MSEPKRYNPSGLVCTCCGKPDAEIQSIMVTHKKGRFVQWDDYARLEAEFDEYRKAATIAADSVIDERNRLQAENERLRASSFVTAVPSEEYEKLKAEVERLRKAGDLLAFHYISLGRKFFPNDPLPPSITEWNAAKEGKSSV